MWTPVGPVLISQYVRAAATAEYSRGMVCSSCATLVAVPQIVLRSDRQPVMPGAFDPVRGECMLSWTARSTRRRSAKRVSVHVFQYKFAKMYLERGGELFKLSREKSTVEGDFASAVVWVASAWTFPSQQVASDLQRGLYVVL